MAKQKREEPPELFDEQFGLPEPWNSIVSFLIGLTTVLFIYWVFTA